MVFCLRAEMASVKGNPGCADEEQKENVTPLEDWPLVLGETTAPLNFCGLTPSHFGISDQSFTPAKSSNSKDKLHVAQMKARRLSSIGVLGSPETNSLICFMAQNRMKTPPPSQAPESSVAARRWRKEVDRSLYRSRAYASKHPVLSPITESPTEAAAESDGGTPEARQEVGGVSCDAATAPAVGAPAGSEGVRQTPTSGSASPPPRKVKRGRRSSTHRAELKLEVEQQQSRGEVAEEEKISAEGAGLAPWQSDFDCEDVFRPVAGSRRSVRRSLRNRRGSEGGGTGQGLAWLPPSPTDQPAEAQRRTRGRRLSSGQPL